MQYEVPQLLLHTQRDLKGLQWHQGFGLNDKILSSGQKRQSIAGSIAEAFNASKVIATPRVHSPQPPRLLQHFYISLSLLWVRQYKVSMFSYHLNWFWASQDIKKKKKREKIRSDCEIWISIRIRFMFLTGFSSAATVVQARVSCE